MENKDTQDKNKPANTQTGSPQQGSTPTSSQTPGQSVGASISGQQAGRATQQSRYSAADAAQEGAKDWDDIKERGAELADKAKQSVTEAYDKTSRTLNEGYEQAVDYSRENPGKTVLIAFGVGIGVGLLLSNNMNSPRSRAGRIVPPVMNALSDIAVQLFR